MRRVILFLVFGFTTVAHGLEQGVLTRNAKKSFLTAASFPTTFDDLSFTDRMAVEAEGYEVWDSEYDASGRCIKNCAYYGITIQEEERLSRLAGDELRRLIEEEERIIEEEEKEEKKEEKKEEESGGNFGGGSFWGPPVIAEPIHIVSDFGKRNVSNGTTYHKGIDISAGMNTPVYAAADGKVVDVVNTPNRPAGKWIEIEHSLRASGKKVHTKYLHLNEFKVKKGDTVSKGQLIALSGNSGRTKRGNGYAPHLHYGIQFGNWFVDPFGAKQEPVLRYSNEIVNAQSTKGTNYLNAPYCFKDDITSSRLQDFKPGKKNAGKLSEYFPGCTGWCY